MYCFTKSPSTNPGLVGTLSQYSLTDQTNYIHFSWALDRGNTFGKLEMMIVIQVQTLSWTPWTPQKGARLMHPGYEQQKTLEGVEMKATSKFSQEIFFEDVFFALSFLEMWMKWMETGNLWSSHLDPTFACLVPVEEPSFFDLILKVEKS